MGYFDQVGTINFEGKGSDNPLSFKHYNAKEVVLGKTMEDHLRFAVAYWHTFTADGSDPFGSGTAIRPWDKFTGIERAKARAEANFEFMEKLNIPFYCFHDRDIAPKGATLQETNQNLDTIVAILQEGMKASGRKLLWNTANMFTNPRFTHGAGTTRMLLGRYARNGGVTRENLTELLRQIPRLRGLPVIANCDFGHTAPIATLPNGGHCQIHASEKQNRIVITEH